MREHSYELETEWTGNDGAGTSSYRSYRRDFTTTCEGKAAIHGSSDPAFRGDPTRLNPEELLVAALSSCHMLSYLHLCSVNGIVVVAYRDRATGRMQEIAGGSGVFKRVLLEPSVVISDPAKEAEALALHHQAHEICFIARSVNFPVEIAAEITHEPRSLQHSPSSPD